MFEFGSTSNKNLLSCHDDIIKVMEYAIRISPIDFGISDGHRSLIKQKECFDNGKSKCDGIIKKSKHNYYPSLACDVYAYVNGKASWDPRHMTMISGCVLSVAEILGIKLKWGGVFGSKDFTGWDMPHYQKKG